MSALVRWVTAGQASVPRPPSTRDDPSLGDLEHALIAKVELDCDGQRESTGGRYQKKGRRAHQAAKH
jgi:hypothetical protein